ncbi:hypothetical protein FVA95_24050 [Pseudonocardia sp. EV170527-09]|nr:hypothetical protein FVA95_24050 [Pseudonocardia sp. EV170527-09]
MRDYQQAADLAGTLHELPSCLRSAVVHVLTAARVELSNGRPLPIEVRRAVTHLQQALTEIHDPPRQHPTACARFAAGTTSASAPSSSGSWTDTTARASSSSPTARPSPPPRPRPGRGGRGSRRYLFLNLPTSARADIAFAAHNAALTIWEEQPLSWTRHDAGTRWALTSHNDTAHLTYPPQLRQAHTTAPEATTERESVS